MKKTGAGSRGGHVIRITKGGNAIYGAPADHQVESKRAKIAKGAAIAAGSLVAAGLIGHGAGKIARKAADLENVAKTAAKAGGKMAQMKVGIFSVRVDTAHKVLENLHSDARYLAAAVGTVGGSYGANEVLDANGKKTERNRALAVGAATAGSLFAVRFTEYAALAPTLVDAAKVAGKKIRTPIKGRRG